MAVVTVAEFKKYAQIDADYTKEDDLIEVMLKAATDACANYTGLSFDEPKVYTEILNSYDDELAHQPVINVIAIDAPDPSYILVARPYNGIKVMYTAGMETVPDGIKVGIMMLAKSLYDNRESYTIADNFNAVSDLPINIRTVLRPYSIHGGLWL